MHKKTLLIVTALIVCVCAAAYLYYRSSSASRYSSSNTPNDALLQSNADYAQAKSLASSGDYQGAIQAYTSALSSAQDAIQKAQIEFNIASQKDHQGDYIGAVQMFKQLADDTSNLPLLRAYAVQWMADINNNGDPAITQEIFSTSPYSGMVVQGDVALTNRHLAEYGSSLFPLARTEIYVAYWYAEQLAASPTNAQAPSYVTIINQKIANTEMDVQRTKNDPQANGTIPGTLQYEAIVKGDLAIAGATSTTIADAAFQRAFVAYTTYGLPSWSDEFTHMYYAIFLMRMFGKSRASDIHNALSPLYTSQVYKNAPIVMYLKGMISANSAFDPTKEHYIGQLASYDPGWKTYLLSLGWTQSDFQ